MHPRCVAGIHLSEVTSLTETRRHKRFTVALIATLLVTAVALGYWMLKPVEHLASGAQQSTFVIECEFDKYRQIMVRKNATKAIVGNSGMELIEEKIQDVEIDASADDRPLLNAIRGKSKTELSAVRLLTVSLNDPQLESDRLVLKQHADIRPEAMHVRTKSIKPAGRLQSYQTELTAVPHSGGTEITLNVSLEVRLNVPKLFTSRADAEVQQAAIDAITDQEESITQFVAEHADARIILPEFLDK
tara:strand:+ start:172296 stop:173033 length:738 start_codon:yes stop_codon:yes gene_type:complete